MGVVYQALDHELGVEIALKVLRAPAPGGKAALSVIEMQRRLRTELVLARQITHKNVIRIHDIGEINGIRFISMPLVKGPDLATVLKGGRLPSARAVRYARQMAAGLIAVHAAGVVHRDLKPGNIMIDADDQAVLMDFGIARSTAPTNVQRTIPGMMVGTPAYMAPEQARGESVDQRTDIYAFGLVLFEMLTGPRADLSMGDLALRMKAPPTPVRQLNPRAPMELEAIVMRCLQPNPADRYQTSVDLASALAALGRRASRDVAPTGTTIAWMRYAAALMMVALIGAGAYGVSTPAGGRLLADTGRLLMRSVAALNPAPLFARQQTAAAAADLRMRVDEAEARIPRPVAAPAGAFLTATAAGPAERQGRWSWGGLLRAMTSDGPLTTDVADDEFQVCYLPNYRK